MAHTSRLHHDGELAQRATSSVVVGIIFVGFLLLAAAATVYDVGSWVDAW